MLLLLNDIQSCFYFKKNLLYIILLISLGAFAQNESTHWYFGTNAGIDFSSGTPIADESGALVTPEGCSTISDADGNLQFYTNGVTVWNRNHTIMPTGNSLLGSYTSSQSAMIIPKPDNDEIYYIFTIETGGANYYVVDMSLDGGLGDVIGTTNEPTATNLLQAPTTEKITAIELFNEDGFWVIA